MAVLRLLLLVAATSVFPPSQAPPQAPQTTPARDAVRDPPPSAFIRGRVIAEATGEATSDATVVVFSDDRTWWMPASRFVRTARPDAGGHFAITGLPAGDYCALVQTFVENGQWEDKDFLEAARETAVRFVLLEGGSEVVSLKLPPGR